jgi:hypothetical protein
VTVKEYLFTSNQTPDELAVILGYKTTSPINKRFDEEMPERWVRRLDELSDLGLASIPAANDANSDNDSEREPKITDDDLSSWINSDGREDEKDPNIGNVNSGVEVIGPQKIKLKTIEGYLRMGYNGAEMVARSRGDFIAADTINSYTDQFVEAWIDYIKYDERILKYLEMMQIGTPLGNLVGIHAISIFSYGLARITAKELAGIANQESTGETEL